MAKPPAMTAYDVQSVGNYMATRAADAGSAPTMFANLGGLRISTNIS
jgi:hypothetical protein